MNGLINEYIKVNDSMRKRDMSLCGDGDVNRGVLKTFLAHGARFELSYFVIYLFSLSFIHYFA